MTTTTTTLTLTLTLTLTVTVTVTVTIMFPTSLVYYKFLFVFCVLFFFCFLVIMFNFFFFFLLIKITVESKRVRYILKTWLPNSTFLKKINIFKSKHSCLFFSESRLTKTLEFFFIQPFFRTLTNSIIMYILYHASSLYIYISEFVN